VTAPGLLAGILFDAEGERMTPSHTLKKSKRYRYYVSSHLVAGASDGRGQRLPATDIESIVIRRLGDWLIDAPAVLDALAGDVPAFGAAAQRTMVDAIGRIAKRWPEMPRDELRQLLLAIDARIHAHVGRVDISLSAAALRQWLTDPHTGERDCNASRLDSATANPGDEPPPDGSRIHLTVAARLQRVGIEMKLIVGDGSQPPDIDGGLVRTLIRASRIREQLARDPGLSLADIAEHEGIVPSYATRIYRLNFLAPDIVEAMLDGRQPPALTLRKLLDDTRLPLDWAEQRQRLGFA
jgi:hypothetical protein